MTNPRSLKVLRVVGARPNRMDMAPVMTAVDRLNASAGPLLELSPAFS